MNDTLADTESVLWEAGELNSRFVEAAATLLALLLLLPGLATAAPSSAESEVGGEVGFDSMSLCSPYVTTAPCPCLKLR